MKYIKTMMSKIQNDFYFIFINGNFQIQMNIELNQINFFIKSIISLYLKIDRLDILKCSFTFN